MFLNKKFAVTIGLLASVVFVSTTAMQQQREEEKPKNLKVLPKSLTNQQVHKIMNEWNASLGVRCNFCHARNEQTGQNDFASDAKPEKEMAREMYRMTANINKKYFKAGKDSLGMVMQSGVNCNTCHRGAAHPEAKLPERPMRQMGPPNGRQGMPMQGPGMAAPQNGQGQAPPPATPPSK